MAQFNTIKSRQAPPLRGASVDALAARVLSVLSSNPGTLTAAKSDKVHLALREAVLSRDGFVVDDVLFELRGLGASDIDLIDVFIPDIARDLGNCWEASTLSFVQVTMGAARLQSLIPHLEMSHLTLDAANLGRADSHLMLIVCPNDDHTLGPMVFASQLRRMGYSVRLSLGRELDALKRQEVLSEFEMIFFSCSYSGALATVQNIVSYLSTLGPRRPRTVLGGPVVDHTENLKKVTGVDVVTNDLTVALAGMNDTAGYYEIQGEKAAE